MSEDDWDTLHIVPDRDLISHEMSGDCPCGPRVDGLIFTHESLDGRERREDPFTLWEAFKRWITRRQWVLVKHKE